MGRYSEISRKTKETDIKLNLKVDGEGNSNIDTGIGFLDHMLTLFAAHGRMDLDLKAKGDLQVDCHHTVEDIGIVLGACIKEALGDKSSIKRYGTSYVPMDETLGLVSLDISGRAFLVFDAEFTVDKVGDLDTEMVEEFFRAAAFNAGITLHIKILHGKNNHHMIEAIFKAFGRALREAVTIDSSIKGVMSTKGIL
ncbi:imidazoleglycerol-phosphate dehydratase HisB [Clostridium sp. 19966]|uniref:imidazoleglycerol-phosphate dehydratase HisB n=1 Tax=Clostridium sp. 19966 TaxID=2768166 RepID=UPI0028DE5A2D|nr:imidazoleglycerol-phosphate dehydratase HisB [Clostridium sp. 19966]MDT8715507.1 imidazoleglycerol-phosphate dehydratase HisB [Clostridium sp. 19966]